MNLVRFQILGTVVFTSVLVIVHAIRATEPPTPSRPATSQASEEPAVDAADGDLDSATSNVYSESIDRKLDGATGIVLSFEIQDSAFAPFVDISLVGLAIASRDAALLTDLALQFSEGERVLLRQHKSGATGSWLFEKAATLAADVQDEVTLDRLAKAADRLGDKDLAAKIASIAKLGGAARAIDPSLTVSLDTVNLEAAIRIKGLLDAINVARLFRDSESLDGIESELSDVSGIADAQKAGLMKLVKSTRVSMAAEGPMEADPIAKLYAASRGRYVWRTRGVNSGWYYVEDGSDASYLSGSNSTDTPSPAPTTSDFDFRITNSGRLYADSTYLGQARRVRFKSGNTGWSYQIPNGWYIYRVDGQSQTRKRL